MKTTTPGIVPGSWLSVLLGAVLYVSPSAFSFSYSFPKMCLADDLLPKDLTVGVTVCVGIYGQDNNTKNGTERIEWIQTSALPLFSIVFSN